MILASDEIADDDATISAADGMTAAARRPTFRRQEAAPPQCTFTVIRSRY